MITDISTIRQICQDIPTKPKLVIIPSMSMRSQVLKSLNDAGVAFMNLEITTVADLAMRSTRYILTKKNITLINDNDVIELIRIVFGRLKVNNRLQYFNSVEPTSGLYKVISHTLLEMKCSGWKQGLINLDLITNEEKRSDIELIMKEYIDMLKQLNLIDMPDLVEIACKTGISNIKYELTHVIEGCQLTYVEEQLLSVLGWTKPTIDDSYLLDYKHALEHIELTSLFKAYGTHTEIKEVLRIIIKEELPFDQVLIVGMSNTPYSTLIYKLMSQYTMRNSHIENEKQMPITFASGVSGTITSPIKLTLSLLDWIDSGYVLHGLIRLISDGVMKLDNITSNGIDNQPLTKGMLVRALNYCNITWQRSTYITALEELSNISEQSKLAALSLKKFIEEEVIKVIPEADGYGFVHVKQFLEGVSNFIIRNTSIKSVIDTQGLTRVCDELKTVIGDFELPLAEVITIIRDRITSITVAEESPSEGKIHFTSIKGAEWIQRKFVFFVGNDANTFMKNSNEDPVLLDKERSKTLKKSSDKYTEDLKDVSRFLFEVKEPVIASYSYFDTVNNRDMFPSLIFQGMKENHTEDSIKTVDLVLKDIESSIDEIDFITTQSLQSNLLNNANEKYPIEYHEIEVKDDLYDSRFDPRKNGMVVSVTMLQTYMECEYRYFLKHILNIKELANKEIDKLGWLSYMEIGKLYHSVFEIFMSNIKLKKEILCSVDSASTEIEKIANNIISEYEKRLPVASEYHTKKEKEEILKNCRRFAQNEYDQKERVLPLEFELVFGKDEELSIELSEDSNLAVTGVIDRVDKNIDGSFINIIDYKTGSTYGYDVLNDAEAEVINTKSIQPILYYLALKAMGLEDVESAEYKFVTSKGDYSTYKIEFDTFNDQELKQGLNVLLDKISTGRYSYVEDTSKCRFCPYVEICKQQEVESQ